MIKYKIDTQDGDFTGRIVSNLGNGDYILQINDREVTLHVQSITSDGMEILLNNKYHHVRFVQTETANISLSIDGTPICILLNNHLDDIVYKNSDNSGGFRGKQNLHSQIPGKVVSIAVSEGDDVKINDTICVLESMKMQVKIKSIRDGKVTSLKIKEGNTVAKGDTIAMIE